MSTTSRPCIPVILGPTASGKTALAIELAIQLNGEVISADSRQIYTGLDIGTGKVTLEEAREIPHHLINIADPRDPEQFTVIDWKNAAEHVITGILTHGKLPIICGGTGFYIEALVNDVSLPDAPRNDELRAELETKSAEELFTLLAERDPERSDTIDPHNKRRIIRALEIIDHMGKVPPITIHSNPRGNHLLYDFLLIGIETDPEVLREKIVRRLKARIDIGMIHEAQRLHAAGLTYERMRELGLEYRYLADYLEGQISESTLVTTLTTKIWQYAKRQMTWFKRDDRIEWYRVEDMEKIIARVKECAGGK